MPQTDSKSSFGQEQQQTVQMAPYPKHLEDDTIDLYELWISLWKRKWIVIALTVVSALGSIVYALQLPHLYRAEALLMPPKSKDFQAINLRGIQTILIQETGIKIGTQLKSEDVFDKFKQNLNSRAIHKKFIQEYGLMEILAPNKTSESTDLGIYSGFANLIMLVDNDGITSFSMEMHDAEIAAQWINNLIEFADKETIAMLIEDLRNLIENRIVDIEYNINSKRLMAEKRREDQIIRYKEHAEIAKALGLIGRVDATNIIQNTQMNADTTSGIRRQSTATSPLYYLGYEALMTEINILHNRKSDDPFIVGLRDLQEQLALLRSIKLDHKNMSSVYIDQDAFPPKAPSKPDRRLIISLATVVGVFSGIFLAFFIEFVQKQRKKHS